MYVCTYVCVCICRSYNHHLYNSMSTNYLQPLICWSDTAGDVRGNSQVQSQQAGYKVLSAVHIALCLYE